MKLQTLTKENIFGAIFMIAGCCIGAGMIGMPVLSAAAGFFPSSIALCLIYLFTTGTGLLLLEAILWFDRRVNLLTIAEATLGRAGKVLVAALFLSLFYAIFVAYLDGGGQMFQAILSGAGFKAISREIGLVLCLVTVALIVRTGIRGVDRINQFLILGLILAYCLILALGCSQGSIQNLSHMQFPKVLGTLPILFICFGFQNMVPSVAHYLRGNAAAIRLAIVVGNLLPLLFYLLWNGAILGMISNPAEIGAQANFISDLLPKTASIRFLLDAFSFLALFTSFITVAISFVDFLRDGFRKAPSDWILEALVFLPPLVVSFLVPNLFLRALSFAGGFIDLILYGLIPIAIVWIGRYKRGLSGAYRFPGGKPLLIGMASLTITLLLVNMGLL